MGSARNVRKAQAAVICFSARESPASSTRRSAAGLCASFTSRSAACSLPRQSVLPNTRMTFRDHGSARLRATSCSSSTWPAGQRCPDVQRVRIKERRSPRRASFFSEERRDSNPRFRECERWQSGLARTLARSGSTSAGSISIKRFTAMATIEGFLITCAAYRQPEDGLVTRVLPEEDRAAARPADQALRRFVRCQLVGVGFAPPAAAQNTQLLWPLQGEPPRMSPGDVTEFLQPRARPLLIEDRPEPGLARHVGLGPTHSYR